MHTCTKMSLILIPLTKVCHKEFGFGQREVWPLPLASGKSSKSYLTRVSLFGAEVGHTDVLG